jgi:protein TonB
MIGRGPIWAVLGSATLHAGAVAAVLALATSLPQPQPLFVDLTGGLHAGDERTPAAPPRGRETADSPAREARRVSARAPRATEPPAQARPTGTAPVAVPSFSAAREAPPAAEAPPSPAADSHAAETPAADTRGGAVTGVSSDSDMPARAGQSPGVVGGGGSLLALAVPGTGRGDVPAEFGPYLALFRQRIQELVVYPLAARRRGIAGRVEVEVVLEPSGRIRDVAVVSSSSHALLDEAAVEAVRSLQPVPLPEHSKRQSLRVRLPVVFQLR